MDNLKSCPFCGGESIASRHNNRYTEWWSCRCLVCLVEQKRRYEYKFEAVEAWNRREP
jgi:Lar family restriction alleviation protein